MKLCERYRNSGKRNEEEKLEVFSKTECWSNCLQVVLLVILHSQELLSPSYLKAAPTFRASHNRDSFLSCRLRQILTHKNPSVEICKNQELCIAITLEECFMKALLKLNTIFKKMTQCSVFLMNNVEQMLKI